MYILIIAYNTDLDAEEPNKSFSDQLPNIKIAQTQLKRYVERHGKTEKIFWATILDENGKGYMSLPVNGEIVKEESSVDKGIIVRDMADILTEVLGLGDEPKESITSAYDEPKESITSAYDDFSRRYNI